MQETKLQEVIRDRNDMERRLGLNLTVTPGIQALEDMSEVLSRVKEFDHFDSGSDPYGEHDFGSFVHHGQKIFWKIDYYDRLLRHWSDPLDRDTRRVLTVMLAEEY